ncbi:MAG: cupin domain-containing protein [Firmicutes bacterium]|nr:cupin domain-containing protein [Bacillota bacterium]MBR5926486.1 cupin domain-containing protein [Bacillota bacterium]
MAYYMKEDQKHEPKPNLRGGVGVLDFTHVVPPAELYGAGAQFGVMTFDEPGYSIGVHSHEANYEIYMVLEGKAKVTDNDEERILGPGDAEICANGNTHSIENIGDGPLKIMACIFNNFERK